MSKRRNADPFANHCDFSVVTAEYRTGSGKPPEAAELAGTRHPVPVAARQPAVTVQELVEKGRRVFFL